MVEEMTGDVGVDKYELDLPAKDFLGNDINVGDEVVYMRVGYRSLHKGFIMRITARLVFMHHQKNPDRYYWDKQAHNQVVKI
jgi:hypothetical protein